jgi:hypothetical protein
MIKPLIMLDNTLKFAPSDPGVAGQTTYQAYAPRVALGLVGAALAAVTIAVSVVLPARVESGGHPPLLQLASRAIPAASIPEAVTSITVVAAREPRSVTGSVRKIEAAPSQGPSGETASLPILRISTAAR